MKGNSALFVVKDVIQTLDSLLSEGEGKAAAPALKINKEGVEEIVDASPLFVVSHRLPYKPSMGFDDSPAYVLVMGQPYAVAKILPQRAEQRTRQPEIIPAIQFNAGCYVIRMSATPELKPPTDTFRDIQDSELRKAMQWIVAESFSSVELQIDAAKLPCRYELKASGERNLTIYKLSDGAFGRLAEAFHRAKGDAVLR